MRAGVPGVGGEGGGRVLQRGWYLRSRGEAGSWNAKTKKKEKDGTASAQGFCWGGTDSNSKNVGRPTPFSCLSVSLVSPKANPAGRQMLSGI